MSALIVTITRDEFAFLHKRKIALETGENVLEPEMAMDLVQQLDLAICAAQECSHSKAVLRNVREKLRDGLFDHECSLAAHAAGERTKKGFEVGESLASSLLRRERD